MKETVTCLDVYGESHEVPAKDLIWRPSVYGIVIKDGAMLVSKQFGDKFDLPGGGLDKGEHPEAGVIREVKEETGIDVANPRLIDYRSSFFQSSHSAENESYHCLMLYFVCDYVGGELSIDGFDDDEKNYADMPEWVSVEQLTDLPVASTVDYRPIVQKALHLH